MVTRRNEWMTFREFFDQATNWSIDLVDAAEALFARAQATKGSIKVAGTLRKWDPRTPAECEAECLAQLEKADIAGRLEQMSSDSPEAELLIQKFNAISVQLENDDGWRERLPRDTQLKVVPPLIWSDVSSVRPNLTSSWIDDPDEPEQTAYIDWIAGTFARDGWSYPSVGGGTFVVRPYREEYSNLCVERSRAKELLKQLAGSLETRGAPKGLRDPTARKISDNVVEAICKGDTRTPGKIVGTLLPRELSVEQAERMQRNIVRDVKRRLAIVPDLGDQ